LPALPRACIDAHRFERHREQAGRDLFARGDDGIVLARIVQRRCLPAPFDELVGRARHGRYNHGNLVPRVHLALDVEGDVSDAVDIGDGRAAEFHNKTGHGNCAYLRYAGGEVGARSKRRVYVAARSGRGNPAENGRFSGDTC
jgi:hypothetical protein